MAMSRKLLRSAARRGVEGSHARTPRKTFLRRASASLLRENLGRFVGRQQESIADPKSVCKKKENGRPWQTILEL